MQPNFLTIPLNGSLLGSARWILGIVAQSISEIYLAIPRLQILLSAGGILLISTSFEIDELYWKTVFGRGNIS